MRAALVAAVAAAGCFLACSDQASDDAAAAADSLSVPGASARGFDPLALGSTHTCIIARRGVACWGDNGSGQSTPPALKHPSALTAGDAHTCALDDDGVKCWGNNSSGQTTVPALRRPVQISAGLNHTCALDDTGVHCWGSNTSQQTTVPALTNPTMVSGGNTHTCAVDATGVKCWGSNSSGQTTVPALRNPTEVRTGAAHSCAIDADGVKCWGSNGNGQTTVPTLRNPHQLRLGANHSCVLDDDGVKCWGSDVFMQTEVPPLKHPTYIRSGRSFNCAVDNDDAVVCWGANFSNQGTVPTTLDLVGHHACVIANGALRCAGDNEHGQLGVGNDQDQPVSLSAAAATNLGQAFGAPVQIAVGHSFGCALGASGGVKCWGSNGHGQLGLGDNRDRGTAAADMGDALPALQLAGSGPVKKLDVGDDHACALAGTDLLCWGKGASGQLGTEATDDVGIAAGATKPHLKTGLGVRDFALGHGHTCVVGTDAAVYCFGDNDAGQLGLGRAGAVGGQPGTMGDAMTPVSLGDGFNVKAIASGARHVCALSVDGRIKCWGASEAGQLGLGDTKSRGTSAADMGNALPAVDLGHGQVVTDLACGDRHCCARTVQNTMKCWGDNSQGQLGLGDVVPRGADAGSIGDNLPFVPTPPHERVLSLQLEGDRTCARTDSGLRCWGRNRSGELGYGDVQVRGGTLTTVPRLLAPLGI